MIDMIKQLDDYFDHKQIKYAKIQTDDIIFRTEFLEKCQLNYCGRYNKSWSCPPAIGDVSTIQKNLLTYSHGVLFQMMFSLEDPYDVEGMNYGREVMMKETFALNRFLEQGQYQFKILSAGSCSLCENCTYPHLPCRHPEQLLISMESLGIDVACLAKKVHLTYYHGPLTVTYFAMCLFK